MHIRIPVKTTYNLFLFSVLIIVLIHILTGLYSDIALGGNDWRQGDWLINNQNQFVRRGIFGSLILFISDRFVINPIILLGTFQGTILISVFLTIALAVARLEPSVRVLWTILSPAFLFMFWYFDFNGSLRKEILVYFSYSIFFIGIFVESKKVIATWSASLLFIFAVFSHEGNFFFLPFFVIALYIIGESFTNEHWYLLVLVVIIGSLGGLGYAIAFSESPDPDLVCDALLQRELSKGLCKGAISFVNRDVDYAINYSKFKLIDSGLYKSYATAYFLSLMPLLAIRPIFIPRWLYFIAVIFGVILFFPLFAIAQDWGRWINFYVTSITMILLMHMNLRPDLYPPRASNSTSFKVFVFLHCFLWSMPHCCREIEWGAIGVAKRVAAKLLVDA